MDTVALWKRQEWAMTEIDISYMFSVSPEPDALRETKQGRLSSMWFAVQRWLENYTLSFLGTES